MPDLNQKTHGSDSGWEWVEFWVDQASYWDSRLKATGDEFYRGRIHKCWQMVDMEIF